MAKYSGAKKEHQLKNLVFENIREVKGSFFTPEIWVKKSQEYLAAVFGADWQEEYYVWDCAAGTGNLLVGLMNRYRIWASTVDQTDVDTMLTLVDIDEGIELLPAHIFQFDFLNDGFEKLPEELRKIIEDPEKRKKLIVYINPPYAEATNARTASGTGQNRDNVAKGNKTRDTYKPYIGAATNELFTQFMARIYKEIPGSKLATFSTLKFICAQHFIKFRQFFRAEYKGGFAVHADTFDNVNGKFPIGFTIWDLNGTPFPKSIKVDIPEEGGVKTFWNGFDKSINQWIKHYDNKNIPGIGFMGNYAPDFQNINQPYIKVHEGTRHVNYFSFNQENMIEGCIYFAVRLCIEHTWLNNQDQFYFPTDKWKRDTEFQNDCLVFSLFHGKNDISCNDGTNHWIPFTEKQVGAKEKFESNFMSKFLKERGLSTDTHRWTQIPSSNPCSSMSICGQFSSVSLAVLDAGLALWKYYHKKIKNDKSASVNASFYDIREYFQGRSEGGNGQKGRMNNRSGDETYNRLLGALREAQKALTAKIQPVVYAYGFLKE